MMKKEQITKSLRLTLAMTAMGIAGFTGIQANADVITVSSYSFTPAATWVDSTGVELTDGNYGVSSDATVVGWYKKSSATITFDLGATWDVSSIVLTGTSGWSGIGGIASVDISVSLDGVLFTDLTNFGGSYTGKPFTRTLDVSGLGNARYVNVKLNGSTWMMLSEVDFVGIVPVADNTPPTLASSDIVDDKSDSPVLIDETVTYTVTFSEAMKASTVETNDFKNVGSAAATIDSVSTTGDYAVFEVAVTPSGTGTLQLQVKSGATLADPSDNALVTTPLITDPDVITVYADTVLPTLVGSDIVDDKSGGPVVEADTVTYTVTFSEPMDASTIGTADFENAGSPAASIKSVTATGDPAVYEVSVTPGGAGTLQLQVKAGAILEDLFENALVTSSPITDATVITVRAGRTQSYKADIAPDGNVWDDAGENPTAHPHSLSILARYTMCRRSMCGGEPATAP